MEKLMMLPRLVGSGGENPYPLPSVIEAFGASKPFHWTILGTPHARIITLKTRTALGRAHTSTKAADVTKLLLLNKNCQVTYRPMLSTLWVSLPHQTLTLTWCGLPPQCSGFFCGSLCHLSNKFVKIMTYESSFRVILLINKLTPRRNCNKTSCALPLASWPLTLKVVSESRVTWATSVPILVFLGVSVLELGPMYATDGRQTRIIA